MKKLKQILTLAFVLTVIFCLTSGKKQTTIFVIGDSTAAEKSDPATNPERGWGMVLQGYFDKTITVDNHAVNGRSSKSFLDEGRWQKVMDRIKPGDYVLIQFGHNDEKTSPERHTDPGTTFDANLERYVTDARSKGAIPVLLSCVVRRNFFKQVGKDIDDEALRNTIYSDERVNSDTLIDTHGAYKDVPRYVAQRLRVTFIDANRLTHELEQGLGVIGSRSIHMWYKPGEVSSIPDGRHDNTHYNLKGARLVAALIASELGSKEKALKRHLVHYDYVVSAKGRGNYMSLQSALKAIPAKGNATVYVVDGKWNITKDELKGKRVKFIVREEAKVNITKRPVIDRPVIIK